MIFKLTKWQLGLQIIYCLSDFHFPKQPHNFVGNEQRIAIVQAAKTHNAHVIVEDVLCYVELGYGYEQRYIVPQLFLMQLTPKESPLYGLNSLCYHAGVFAINVEFRNGICASYFENYDTPSTVLARVEEIIKRIASYDDGPIANAWYKKILDEYTLFSSGPGRSFLEQLQEQGDENNQDKVLRAISYSPEMQEALKYVNPNIDWNDCDSYDQKSSLLNMFHYKLLDAELVHALMQQTKKTIFMCAGALHISNIEPLLEQLGYKKVLSEGNDVIVKENEYLEPDTIPVERLSLLLESKDVSLPLLLRNSLYIQSFLDSTITSRPIREALLSLSTLATTTGILSVLPTCIFNKTAVRCFFSALVMNKGILWYLTIPQEKQQN